MRLYLILTLDHSTTHTSEVGLMIPKYYDL